MRLFKINLTLFIVFVCLFTNAQTGTIKTDEDILVGARRFHLYIPLLKGKRVGVIANQTSLINKSNLVDTLLSLGINVKMIFCPEHGFRGKQDAGTSIANEIDSKTKLPIYSLYGKNKKPSIEQMALIDVLVFDIQDIGARFYTYSSTMALAMEACAENNKQFIVLDRPNPLGFYVDGPVLEPEFASFVGLFPVPIVHGLTIAEYAQMINGEGWLKNGVKCNLKTVTCVNYHHFDHYQLPVPPSPNLPNMTAVYLYPSLCLFEGTVVSVGRGTSLPFQLIGSPDFKSGDTNFIPKSVPGAALNPPYKDVKCRGYNLTTFGSNFIVNYNKLYLTWLLNSYNNIDNKSKFFNDFFNNLAGNNALHQQIINNTSEDIIRKSWEPKLSNYKIIRKKYLLYPDFD